MSEWISVGQRPLSYGELRDQERVKSASFRDVRKIIKTRTNARPISDLHERAYQPDDLIDVKPDEYQVLESDPNY